LEDFKAGVIVLMHLRTLFGLRVGIASCDVYDGERAIGMEVAYLEISQAFLSSSRTMIGGLHRNNASDVARTGTICGEKRAGVLEMRRHSQAINSP
jgi:hypothetical protein